MDLNPVWTDYFVSVAGWLFFKTKKNGA
jgi:hypothetical protein